MSTSSKIQANANNQRSWIKLLAIGGTVSEVEKPQAGTKLKRFCDWLARDWERANHIDRELEARKAEIYLNQANQGFPLKFL